MKQALEGRVLNSWTIREVEHVRRTRVWIVKFIRANRMLGWIAQTFPVRPPVLVLRHPCAVVASQIAYGFPRPGPPDDPRLLADHPAFADIIASLQTDEELRTAHWCLDTVVPLSLPKPHPWHVIVFEALASRGIGEIEHIFRLWRLDTPPDLDRRMAEWSSTARNQSSRSRAETLTEWRKLLRPDQIRRVLEVVQAFGIDFYGDDPQPDEERLVNWSPLSHS